MKHCILRCWLFLLLCLMSCNEPTTALPSVIQTFDQAAPLDTARWQAYQDEKGRYRVAYPVQWTLLSSAVSTDITHFVNLAENGTTRAGITIIVQEPNANLSAVADKAQKTLQAQNGISEFEVISEIGVTVNGLRGLERIVQYKIAEQALTNRTIYLRHPQYLFALILTTENHLLMDYTPRFEEVIRTFTVLK